MDAGLLAQYIMNGLMLGMMYALVAVGFTLFFGVLDVIKFSHGDVLTVGAFAALATYVGLQAVGLKSNWLDLVAMIVIATAAMMTFSTCCGPTCRKPRVQSRRSGIAKSRGLPPKPKRIALSIMMLTAIEAIASVSAL